MTTDSIQQILQSLRLELGRQIGLRTQLAGLLVSKKAAAIATQLITIILLFGIISMVIFFLSFAFVFWYGNNVGPYHHGFLIISLVYAIGGLMVYLNRRKLILEPIFRKLTENDRSFMQASPDGPVTVNSMEDLDKQLEIIRLKVEYSELLLQQELLRLGDSLHPVVLLDRLMEQTKPLKLIGPKILDLLLAFLTRKKNETKED